MDKWVKLIHTHGITCYLIDVNVPEGKLYLISNTVIIAPDVVDEFDEAMRQYRELRQLPLWKTLMGIDNENEE